MLDRAFYTETLILLRWALKYKTNIFRNVSFIYEHPIDCFPLIILIIRIFLVIKTVITFVLETWFISSVHRRELLNNSPCLHVVCFSFFVCVYVDALLWLKAWVLPVLQIFGGLVWILVACTLVVPQNPQGWVMFVSVFCFVMTFIWTMVFACGGHNNRSSWAAAVSNTTDWWTCQLGLGCDAFTPWYL